MSFRTHILFIIFSIAIIAPVAGQHGAEIMKKRAEEYKKRQLRDSLLLVEKEKIWNSAIVSEGILQPDGYFTLNIMNETNENAYIYIDGEYTLTVNKNSRLMDYKVRNIKTIYAITYDKSYKWGPMDLTTRTEDDFYWKLTLPKKKDVLEEYNADKQ